MKVDHSITLRLPVQLKHTPFWDQIQSVRSYEATDIIARILGKQSPDNEQAHVNFMLTTPEASRPAASARPSVSGVGLLVALVSFTCKSGISALILPLL